jgi:hypothetical protein
MQQVLTAVLFGGGALGVLIFWLSYRSQHGFWPVTALVCLCAAVAAGFFVV